MSTVDRMALQQRIQGFGNVNPPPLEDDTTGTLAKRTVSKLGDMIGEEVMLTVEDFREKGAVGAVKDAVADAGDILIDGVSGIFGWIRGEPPPEDDNPSAEDATKALSNGPNGAAYGISQASPTGGINAVWVMPEDADPAALQQLAAQAGGLTAQQQDPRVPKNIQPYQAPPTFGNVPAPLPGAGLNGSGMQIPGGPVIAPYQPAPGGGPNRTAMPNIPAYNPHAGAAPGAGGYVPGAAPGAARWGPGGYAGYNPASGTTGGSTVSGAKSLVERVSKGEVIPGPDVAKRLVSQCSATKTTAKQLADIFCERCRRLYLGLDGGDPADADDSLGRLLRLADAVAQQNNEFTAAFLNDIREGVAEEMMSLRSSAKHKGEAEVMLKRLGFLGGVTAAVEQPDLLSATGVPSTESADLLGNEDKVRQSEGWGLDDDLLGKDGPAPNADLLGGSATSSPLDFGVPSGSNSGSNANSGVDHLDPLAPSQGSSNAELLNGLNLYNTPAAVVPTPAPAAAMAPVMNASSHAAFTASAASNIQGKEKKKTDDAFGFVGAEMSKSISRTNSLV